MSITGVLGLRSGDRPCVCEREREREKESLLEDSDTVCVREREREFIRRQ